MTSPLRGIRTRNVPQTERADTRQVRNDSGGYSFVASDLDRLKRFLVLGVDSGTANLTAHELARQNAGIVERFIQDNAPNELADTLIDTIVDFSVNNRAPRQQPGLFALAMAAGLGDRRTRLRALSVLPQVARTGTTLFEFVQFVLQFRGWGRALRTAVRHWYTDKDVADAAFQAVKYRQRAGWTHRDLLRLTHPKVDGDVNTLFRWVTNRVNNLDLNATLADVDALAIIDTFERLQRASTVRQVTDLIAAGDVTWEMIPDRFINDPAVWHALLEGNRVGATALMRQLPRLTRIGVITPLGNVTPLVIQRVADPERLRRGRVHPFSVLLAQRTYASGVSVKGSSTWTPVRQVVDALDGAFYASYGNVQPTGKRLMLSLDVSGTMRQHILNTSIEAREAASALALITANTEDRYEVNAFTGSLVPLDISPRQRLDDVLRRTSRLPYGPTDCALPMLTAAASRTEVDTFVIYTDSETNRNSVHPHVALQRYRDALGINARLVVVALTSTGFTIANPDDAGMLDLVGFDAALPNLVSGFARGEF